MNPTDVRRGIEMSVKLVIAELKKMAQPVQGTDRIQQVPRRPITVSHALAMRVVSRVNASLPPLSTIDAQICSPCL